MTAALDKLIAAVEAGGETRTGIEEISAGVFGLSETSVDVGTAYNGSLDAAKALHVSLLGDGAISRPGYYSCVWLSGKASIWDVISGVSFHAEIPERAHHEASPARAWLLAILRAYRGMQA